MKRFKEFRSNINELNGQTGPVLKISYKPQRAGGKLTSHSTITKSDLYEDIVYNNKHWKITENTNSLAFRLPHAKGREDDRKDFMGLLKSAKGDVSNLIRGGGFTRSEVQELKRDYEKAIKVFKGDKVVSQDHEIYVSHKKPGGLNVKAGLLAMLKALDEFGMRNHLSLSSRDGVLTQIQDAGQYNYNESVNEDVSYHDKMAKAHYQYYLAHESEVTNGGNDDHDYAARAHDDAYEAHKAAAKLARRGGSMYKKALDKAKSASKDANFETETAGRFKNVRKPNVKFPKESVNEGIYTRDDGGAYDGLRIAKYLSDKDGNSRWSRVSYGQTDSYLKTAMDMLKRDPKKAREILSKPTPRSGSL